MAGRPRSFDREKALDTAVDQFWRHGYEETTVASLTKAMGISPPSLYAAFGDKEQLFAEAAEVYSSCNLEELDAALDLPTTRESIAELLRHTASAHTDANRPPGCFVLTERRLADKREVLRRRIAARIERGLAEEDIPPDTDPDQLAGFLVAVLGGMSTCARDGGSAAQVSAIASLALDII
jgi:AcrR family transcriptional regulator